MTSAPIPSQNAVTGSSGTHPVPEGAADNAPPAIQPDTESAAFAKAYPHLDLDQIPDPWGRPIFKHSHVRALWEGWFARACLDDRAQCGVQTVDAIINAARECVGGYPVASGIIHTSEGDGYGWLRALRLALEAHDASSVVSSADPLPPDWKQDQAETSRLAPKLSSTNQGAGDVKA